MNTERPLFRIDTMPTLPTRGCRSLARMLGWGLSYGNYAIALLVWWRSDWFLAIGTFLLGFIVFGIVRSKLRNDAIPLAQRELPYSDYAIMTWYLSRNHCFTLPSTRAEEGECETCTESSCDSCADKLSDDTHFPGKARKAAGTHVPTTP